MFFFCYNWLNNLKAVQYMPELYRRLCCTTKPVISMLWSLILNYKSNSVCVQHHQSKEIPCDFSSLFKIETEELTWMTDKTFLALNAQHPHEQDQLSGMTLNVQQREAWTKSPSITVHVKVWMLYCSNKAADKRTNLSDTGDSHNENYKICWLLHNSWKTIVYISIVAVRC